MTVTTTTITISGRAHSAAYAQLCQWQGQGIWIEDGPYLVAKIACERAELRIDPPPTDVASITTSREVWKAILEALDVLLDRAIEKENQHDIDTFEQAIQHINEQLKEQG